MNRVARDPIPEFLQALHSKSKVIVKFHSTQDGGPVRRTCAPLDFGPSRRTKDPSPRYHFWDFTSDEKPHALSLGPRQILSIEILDLHFDPATIITWRPAWHIQRDWGPFS